MLGMKIRGSSLFPARAWIFPSHLGVDWLVNKFFSGSSRRAMVRDVAGSIPLFPAPLSLFLFFYTHSYSLCVGASFRLLLFFFGFYSLCVCVCIGPRAPEHNTWRLSSVSRSLPWGKKYVINDFAFPHIYTPTPPQPTRFLSISFRFLYIHKTFEIIPYTFTCRTWEFASHCSLFFFGFLSHIYFFIKFQRQFNSHYNSRYYSLFNFSILLSHYW